MERQPDAPTDNQQTAAQRNPQGTGLEPRVSLKWANEPEDKKHTEDHLMDWETENTKPNRNSIENFMMVQPAEVGLNPASKVVPFYKLLIPDYKPTN